MRRVLASLILCLPLIAAGQDAGAPRIDPWLAPGLMTPEWVATHAAQGPSQQGMLLPLWQTAGGRVLALTTGVSPAHAGAAPMDFRVVDVPAQVSSGFGLSYDVTSHVQAHAGMAQRGWLDAAGAGGCAWANSPDFDASCLDDRLVSPRVLDSEFGASFHAGGYRLGFGVSTSKPVATSPSLPRVLPNTPVTTSGLPLSALDSSTSLNANGRVPLGNQAGIDLGASMGRIRLLPGNLLGIDTLGQKSLSLGVDSGPLSGRIVGRVVQPETGDESVLGPDKRWTSVDLGVTWRLPWQGELSFGAQNLWSSGQPPVPKAGPEPDQSRIPYVQYHQDL